MACRERIDRALERSNLLLTLVNDDRVECDHDAYPLMNGILRDCALQIRRTAGLRRSELVADPCGRFAEGSN